MNRLHTEAMEARARELYEQHPFGDFCYGFERERHNAPLCGFLRNISAQGLVLDIGCGAGYWCELAVTCAFGEFAEGGTEAVNDFRFIEARRNQ